MADLIGDILIGLVRSTLWRGLCALVVKVLTWLDGKIPARRLKVAVGMALGLAAYILVPIVSGLLGF